MSNFWANLKQPIIGLSPMDGVTDAAFRYIADTVGKPDILVTEFTPVEGIARGAHKLLYSFVHHPTKTPTIAQIFGTNQAAYYQSAFVIAEMGFDGIDINMGCPDKHIAKKGGGAGLIKQPRQAQLIITETTRAVKEWAEGKKIESVGLPESITGFVKNYVALNPVNPTRKLLPVSVKTRIGFDEIVTEKWIQTLLEKKPAAISLHGRTLKQMYSGEANWDEIAKAAELVRKTNTVILGNGDIKSMEDAHFKIKKYNTHGALIGRAALGNPWIFTNTEPSTSTRLTTLLNHCREFNRLTPESHFPSLRKHLAWYCKNFDNAALMRVKLMQVNILADVETILHEAERALSISL